MAEAFPKDDSPVKECEVTTDTDLGCQQYELHLKKENNDVEYEKTGHVISVTKNDNPDNKRVFFNHHEIPENNHAWHDKAGISFHHGTGDSFVGGDFNFNHDNQSALGSFQQGLVRKPAMLLFAPPKFNVVLSKNAGATAVHEGTGLKLNWDVNSAAWKNTHWSQPQFEYSYQVKAGPIIAGQTTAVFHLSFLDIETKVEWKANNQPNVMGEYISYTISPAGRVSFDKNTAKPPNDPNRTSTEFPHIFPDQMVFDMNEFGTMFNGAMAIATTGKPTTVYAIKGSPKNNSILGPYMLYANGRPHSTFAVSNSKLLVNDVPVAKSGVTHNTLWWNDLSEEHSDASGLTKNGSIDFSKDGSKGIIFRKSKDEPLMTVKAKSLNTTHYLVSRDLNLYGLLAMDPNAKSSDGTTDVVQVVSMQDFYKIIQYYMDDNLRTDFVSINPPEMHEILNIAVDNRVDNSHFYGTLSIPYLVQTLSNSTQSGANELNGIRASKMLNQGFFYNESFKNTYQDQTQQLYSLRFENYFPLMSEYLLDQKTEHIKYSKLILSDSDEWIKEAKKTVVDNDDEKESLKKTIGIMKNLAHNAIAQRLYWAYVIFRYITSPHYLIWLQSNMLNPNGSSEALTLSIKKYINILQILDPSGEFSIEFLNFMKKYQYFSILSQLLNLSNLTKDFNVIVKKIFQLFIEKYANSTDAKMAASANALKKEIDLNDLKHFQEIFQQTLLKNAGYPWLKIVEIYEQNIVTELGGDALNIAELYTTAVSVVSIIYVINGAETWAEMSAINRSSFLSLAFTLFQKYSVKIILEKLTAKQVFNSSHSSWSDITSTYLLNNWKFLDRPSEFFENGFAKWLVNIRGPGKTLGKLAVKAANAAEDAAQVQRSVGRMQIAFGRNLSEFYSTRVATVLAVVGIITSAIQLSQSDTELEKAMNGLLLTAGLLDLISAAGGWALSIGVAEASSTALATVFGFAAGLSVLAAIAGCIILLVILTKKDPATPLENFVEDQAAKAGYRMPKCIDIDYFQITKTNDQVDGIGVSISEDNNVEKSIRVLPNKTFEISALTNESDTVWEIETDHYGYAKFATFVFPDDKTQDGVFIKLKGGNVIAEGTNGENENEQKWICEISGDPNYETITKQFRGTDIIEKFLHEGTFTIKNVASFKNGVNDYLNIGDGKLVVKNTPMNWVLKIQGVKPSHLSMNNITLHQYDHLVKTQPILLQPGSEYGKTWALSPNLPTFIAFDDKTGEVSQKSDVENFSGTFELTVTNHYGSTKTTFMVEASTK